MKKTILIATFIFAVFIGTTQERTALEQLSKNSLEYANQAIVLGDTIMVVDSALTYFQGNYSYPTYKSINRKFYPDGSTMLRWRYQWNNAESILFLISSDSLVYMDNGDIKERYHKDYNSSTESWNEASQYIYNENGFPLIEEYKNWNYHNSYYINGNQNIYEYDEFGLLAKKYTNTLDTATGYWQNSSLWQYSRDQNGNNTLRETFEWNTQNQAWDKKLKVIQEFDVNNNCVLSENYQWDNENQVWFFYYKSEFIYNENQLFDTITQIAWSESYELWYPDYRQIYSWNEDGSKSQMIFQNYDMPYELWLNDYKLNWEYENGHEVFYTKKQWVNQNIGWKNDEERYSHYNVDGVKDTTISKRWSTYVNDWSSIDRSTIAFNENGTWDYYLFEISLDGGLWEDYYKSFYYYSPFVGPDAIPEQYTLNFKVYPNPSKGKFHLQLTDENMHGAMAFISDINGRRISTHLINSTFSTIDLSELKSGIYFLSVSDGKITGVKRIIIN